MRLYSTKETAEILKVSIRTLKYWRKEGKLVPEVRGAKGAKFYSEVQILEVQKLLKSANSRGAKFTPQIQECKNIEVQSTLKNEKTLETRESGENETREFVTPQIQECKNIEVQRVQEMESVRGAKSENVRKENLEKNNVTGLDEPMTQKNQTNGGIIMKSTEKLKEKVNLISWAELESHGVLLRARKKGYVCPFCGNGSGEDGTGIEPKKSPDHIGAKCQRCSEKIDNIKILAEYWHLDYKNDFLEILKRAGKEFFNEGYKTKTAKPQNNLKDSSIKDLKDMIISDISVAKENLREFISGQGGKYRGLTLETYEHFDCGYIPEWIHPKIRVQYEQGKIRSLPLTSPRLIIPAGEHYNAVMLEKYRTIENKANWKMHAGSKYPFGFDFLTLNISVLYVVEGEIDAMSIWQATGGKVAVIAISGAAESKWIDYLVEKFPANKPKILLLFDSDEAGKKNATDKCVVLRAKGFSTVDKYFDTYLPSDTPNLDKVDANDILREKGEEYLADILSKMTTDAQGEFDKVAQELAEKAKAEFDSEIEEVKDITLTDSQKKILFRNGTTDEANADRMAAVFEGSLRFVTDTDQWAIYENYIWHLTKTSSPKEIMNLARKTGKVITKYAETDDEKKKAYPFKVDKKATPACKMLRAVPNIRIESKVFDTYDMLLPVLNGVIDLKTGELLPHNPNYYFTRLCPVEYNPSCKSPKVEQFLRDIQPDETSKKALLRFLGYCLTGDVREEKALFIVGGGRNGKGTLSRMLMTLLGDFATPFKIDALLQRRFDKDGDAPTPEFAKLENRRLVIANEVPMGRKLDVAHFKDLTGGDKISIRRMHQESSTIENPTWKFILSGQHLPELTDANDIGLQERILILEFLQSFTGDKCDPNLKYELLKQENLSGLLTLLVEECIAWQKYGLIASDAMKLKKQEYLDANNFVKNFIEENCIFDRDYSCSRADLLNAFEQKDYSAYCSIGKQNLIDMIRKTIERDFGNEVVYKRITEGYQFFGMRLRKFNEKEFQPTVNDLLKDAENVEDSEIPAGIELQNHSENSIDFNNIQEVKKYVEQEKAKVPQSLTSEKQRLCYEKIYNVLVEHGINEMTALELIG